MKKILFNTNLFIHLCAIILFAVITLSYCWPILDGHKINQSDYKQFLGMSKAATHPELGDIRLIRSPINLSRHPHPEGFHRAAPDTGQDSDEVLREFGFTTKNIASLMKKGAIA